MHESVRQVPLRLNLLIDKVAESQGGRLGVEAKLPVVESVRIDYFINKSIVDIERKGVLLYAQFDAVDPAL